MFSDCALCFGCTLCFSLLLVVSTSVIDCLERLVSEMTNYVSSGTLNPTHSFTYITVLLVVSVYLPIYQFVVCKLCATCNCTEAFFEMATRLRRRNKSRGTLCRQRQHTGNQSKYRRRLTTVETQKLNRKTLKQ